MTGAIGFGGRKEEVVFPPVEISQCSAPFLACAITRNWQLVRALPQLAIDGRNFTQTQFLVVADSATANCAFLPKFFGYLQKELPQSVAFFSPCLLRQMSRLLVLNLERQGVCSPLPLVSKLLL